MKKTQTLTVLIAAFGMAVAAAEFPYGVEDMADRHKTDAVKMSSMTPTSVPKVGGGMPDSDSVATLYADFVAFSATTNWAAESAAAGEGAAVGLSMKAENGTFTWMGRTGGAWAALSGVAATEGAHQVRADIDFSLGSGDRKVRYTVDGVALAASNGETWLPIGTDCDKITEVLLYGECETRAVTAQSGARRLSDAKSVSDNTNMDYTKLSVDVALGDDLWGLSNVVVTVKQGGKTVGAVTNAAASATGGICQVDVSGLVTKGEAYSYDVTLVGGYGKTKLAETARSDATANMFASADWFGFQDGQFINATTSGIRNVSMFEFGADGTGKGTVTPTEPSGEKSVVTLAATITVGRALAADELPSLVSGQQFGLTMKRCDDGTRSWACNSGGGWLEVAGSGVITSNGTYNVLISADYSAPTPRVAFAVKVGGAYAKLKSGETEWFDLPAGADGLGRLALYGGSVGALNVAYKTTGAVAPTVDAENHEIRVNANASVDLGQSGLVGGQSYAIVTPEDKRYHVKWSDAGGKYAVMQGDVLTVRGGEPCNGISSFESHVLGLDPDDPDAALVLKPVQTADPTHVRLSLPNVRQKSERETGVAVTYKLVESTSAGGEAVKTTTQEVPTFDASLPESGVRYYKIEVKVGE